MVLHVDVWRFVTQLPCFIAVLHFTEFCILFVLYLNTGWANRKKWVKREWSIKTLLLLPWRTSEGLCLCSDFGLQILGGSEQSQAGLGRLLSPSGAWGGFQKTLPVTSGPLRTVNHALCRSVSAQQPQLPPQLEMQYATYPRRWTTQEACGVTHRKTNVHVLVQSHKHNTVEDIQIHTCMYVCMSRYACPPDVRWIGLRHQGWGGKGISQQAVVWVVSLTGIRIPQKLPTSSLPNIKGLVTLWVQRAADMSDTPRKHPEIVED